MRIRLSALAVAGLTIGFGLPAFAELKDTADPRITPKSNLLGDVNALAEFAGLRTKYVEALNRLDAAAMAAFYTEDGIVVTPDGWFSGRENIKKWYEYMFQRWHPANSIRQDDQITAVGSQAWVIGRWWSTLQSRNGPVLARGFWSAIFVRGSDAWKIQMANYNASGDISVTPAGNSTAEAGDE
jgi:ketosteroid isomerase-like protein